jgi:hypothetical protein
MDYSEILLTNICLFRPLNAEVSYRLSRYVSFLIMSKKECFFTEIEIQSKKTIYRRCGRKLRAHNDDELF